VTRQPLTRLKNYPDSEFLSKYQHPHGFRIVRRKRSWSDRVGAMRGASLASPLYWWEIRPTYARYSTPSLHDTATLGEAREWCDGRKYDLLNGRVVLYSE
jgi:hypothetical protein